MANFIGMVYGTLKAKGIDTSKMSTEEAIAKFNEISKEDGGSSKGSGEQTKATPNKQQVIDDFYEKANFGTDSKNVTIEKVDGTKVYFTFMGQKDVFDTAETNQKTKTTKTENLSQDLGIYANENDKEFLTEAVKEMNKYRSNWSFMTQKQKREIMPSGGLLALRKRIKQAEARLEQLKDQQ